MVLPSQSPGRERESAAPGPLGYGRRLPESCRASPPDPGVVAPLVPVAQPAGQAPDGADELGGVQVAAGDRAVDARSRGPAAAELEGAPPLVVEKPRPAACLTPASATRSAAARLRRGRTSHRSFGRARARPSIGSCRAPARSARWIFLAHEAHDVLALLEAKMVVTAHGRLPISICRRKQHRIKASRAGLLLGCCASSDNSSRINRCEICFLASIALLLQQCPIVAPARECLYG